MMRIVTAFVVLALVALASPVAVSANPGAEPQRWIVQLRPGTDVEGFVGPAERRFRLRAEQRFKHVLRGFAAKLSEHQRTALLADPQVVSITPDLPTQITSDPPQLVPPGITRVGADPSAIRPIDGSDPTLDVDIAVLDTGVEKSHPDLRVVGGQSCTNSTNPGSDPHGHGTHVAGIAAARDNGTGVVGVAPGARIWSVKVLNGSGNGYTSWLICGLDWVASRTDPADPAKPLIEVANMSLRSAGSDDGNCGRASGDLLHQAVCRLDRAGVTIVAAAGNDADNAARYVPAAYDEVITVSALADYDGLTGGLGPRPAACMRNDADDAFAGFSNYGADVDLIGPGVCVLSTFREGGYTLMSGTSMAAPHVAGGAALYHLSEAAQGRSRTTPQQARAALIRTGSVNWNGATDPDGRNEPALNVASLKLAPSFAIGAGPRSQTRGPGERANLDVWLARLGGFEGDVGFSLSGLPEGSSWSIAGGPFGAAESGWRRFNINLPQAGAAGTYTVEISAGSTGQATRKTSVKLHFEGGIVGAAGAPRVLLRSGVATKEVAIPVRVSWQSVTGAQRYRLQVSRAGDPWTDVNLASATALSVNVNAWPGTVYRYRLRVKKSGSWGAWLLGPPTVLSPQHAGEKVRLSGTWTSYTSSKSYSEVPAYSKEAGARARLDFVGRSVSWITTRGPTRGKARVYIDGVLVAKLDLYSSTAKHRRVVFSKSWATSGSHRIVIEVRATTGRPRVDVDAVVVVSTD